MSDYGTLRTVKVITSEDVGISQDLYGTIDSNPDRIEYSIEPTNCTIDEFMEWFFETEYASEFCTDGKSLIDIGGSTLNLSIGQTLSISYSDWFEPWLNRRVDVAKREIASSVEKALVKIHTEL